MAINEAIIRKINDNKEKVKWNKPKQATRNRSSILIEIFCLCEWKFVTKKRFYLGVITIKIKDLVDVIFFFFHLKKMKTLRNLKCS